MVTIILNLKVALGKDWKGHSAAMFCPTEISSISPIFGPLGFTAPVGSKYEIFVRHILLLLFMLDESSFMMNLNL